MRSSTMKKLSKTFKKGNMSKLMSKKIITSGMGKEHPEEDETKQEEEKGEGEAAEGEGAEGDGSGEAEDGGKKPRAILSLLRKQNGGFGSVHGRHLTLHRGSPTPLLVSMAGPAFYTNTRACYLAVVSTG